MDEQQARSDLEYIRSVMADIRRRNVIDGIYYMIWGVVIPLCTALTWWLGSSGKDNLIGMVWVIGTILGVLSSFITGWYRSRNGDESPQKPELRFYYTAWILFGITALTVLTVWWVFDKLSINESLFILGLLLAMVFALDASFSGMKWLYAVAAGWLIIGTLGLWLSFIQISLIFGFAAIPLELVPGAILTRIYRRELHGLS